jgi:membrane associated rhomboid family serine protease
MPLSDRDYMKNPPPPPRRPRRFTGFAGAFGLNPVLVLIVINFVFYIATLINGNIVDRLGLIPALFAERPWAILTAMFLHISFWHLFGNMLTLFFFGTFLVRLVGNNWFLLLYFVGGLVGNALYLWLGEPASLALGASGAVYAIAGALVVMMPRLPVRLYFVIPVPLWVVVLVFFVLWSIPGVIPGIAWQAHLGGLAIGLIAGFFFRRRIRYDFYR